MTYKKSEQFFNPISPGRLDTFSTGEGEGGREGGTFNFAYNNIDHFLHSFVKYYTFFVKNYPDNFYLPKPNARTKIDP